MRVLIVSITLVLNLILESTVFQYIRVFDIQPNITVLIIISYAILRGDIEGAAVGFFAGLAQDIFFGDIIGVSALLGFLIGYVCGKPFKDFFHENDIPPLLLAGAGILIYEFFFYFFAYLFRGETDFFHYFNRIILPGSVYTLAFAIPVYRLVYLINSKLEIREKSMRKLF